MESTLLWTPSEALKTSANLTHYRAWLAEHHALSFNDYSPLWQWSVEQPEAFWSSLLQYFDVRYDGSYTRVLSADLMPHTHWFEGIRLNYAEHIFRKATAERPAIIFQREGSPLHEVSWQELSNRVTSLQHFLKAQGVKAGDRVAAYMPCIPEATVAFLAVNGLGAVWSSCSPDFGTNSVIDRFVQITPKVLLAVDHYVYGGKTFDKNDVVRDVIAAIPSLEHVVVLNESPTVQSKVPVSSWRSVTETHTGTPEFVRVPFGHPIWILYSSGTTGLPKAIVHSQGGILLEHLKYGTFHNDFREGERCFWYTTTGWMMWNYIQSSLLAGSTLVLYDGSPGYPDLTVLWKFVQDAGIHHFGTSAGFILANLKGGVQPGRDFNLSTLRSIGSTGSTLPPEGFEWVYKSVKPDVWLASMSGGTDVCSAFVGGNPCWPVYAGEIQCRALGCRLEAYNEDGQPVLDEVGEMVITRPMPSMPVYFWNDPDFKRYTESYFDVYPGVWRHGDWTQITPRQGVIIYGRSDATLNRGGIRIGTSEIYRAVDKVAGVKDSLIICVEKNGGEFWMPLFVVLQPGVTLDGALQKTINTTIRNEYSPRHVPDEIIAVPDVPYTISGKKTETPVKKIFMGKDPKTVVNAGSLRNPESMDFFVALAGRSA